MDFSQHFADGLAYEDFLAKYGTDEQRRRWRAMHERVELSAGQIELLVGFRREMKVLVMAGAWCGDCVEQCPILQRFACANDKIRIRYADRDDCGDLKDKLLLCGAPRVPQAVFLSEDDHLVGRYGDRTLAKYRDLAATLDGAACPSGLVGPGDDLLTAVVQDWLNEFERVQLLLRTSPRLREKHGD